jgi:hypothetical protein
MKKKDSSFHQFTREIRHEIQFSSMRSLHNIRLVLLLSECINCEITESATEQSAIKTWSANLIMGVYRCSLTTTLQ